MKLMEPLIRYYETIPFPLSKCRSKSTLNLGGVSAESFPVAQSWAIMVMIENQEISIS